MATKRNWRVRGKSLQLRVPGGTDINGKRIEHTKTVSDYNPDNGRRWSDAQRNKLWDKFAADVREGRIERPSTLTVNDICNYHIDKALNMSEETRKGYRSIVKIHFTNGLGERRASAIKKAQIKAWVKYLTEEYDTPKGGRLSAKSIKNVFGLLSASYNHAIEDDLLSNNPCTGVKLPSIKPKQEPFLDYDSAIAFMQHLSNLPDKRINEKVGLMLAIMCGLRRGEICGIREKDVDFDARTISVQKARYQSVGGGTYETDPKSIDSVRVVAMPGILSDEIRHLIDENCQRAELYGTQWKASPTLLKSPSGGPYYPGQLWKFLNDALEECGLDHVGLHGLRRTYASMIVDMDVDIKTTSKLLGHNDVNVTNRYIAQFKRKDTAIADAIEDIFMRSKS